MSSSSDNNEQDDDGDDECGSSEEEFECVLDKTRETKFFSAFLRKLNFAFISLVRLKT